MQPADALVADDADQQVAAPVEDDTVRLAKLRLRSRFAIAAESRRAGARDRGDDAALHVYFADHVAVALGDIEVALRVEAQLVRHVERGANGRSAIARMTALAGTCDDNDALRGEVQPADALVVEIAKVQAAVGADDQAVRIVDLRVGKAEIGRASCRERV